MRWKYVLKLWARSRSLDFALRFARNAPAPELATLRWRGHEVLYRPGTSDATIIYAILLKRGTKAEYYLPDAVRPEVILDVGSHIGTSILYFHDRFPAARIIGFEPHPETFALLQRNVAHLPNVSVFNCGLGAADANVSVSFPGSDFSGFHTREENEASSANSPVECEIRRSGSIAPKPGADKGRSAQARLRRRRA